MGQTEGKLAQPAPASVADTSSPPQSSSHSTFSSSSISSTVSSSSISNPSTSQDNDEDNEEGEQEEEGEGEEGEENNDIKEKEGSSMTDNMLKRSTEGISKIGANIISTAKGKVPYTNYSVSAPFKKAASVVEDAIVTVKAGITKTEEEPELEALSKMALFFPIIRSSVPITDLAKGIPLKRTTIEYIDPKTILDSLLAYQRYLTFTSKMVAARQGEVITKIRDVEMSTGRKAVFTLAIGVTDMRHFNTQFSEIARFHTNLERTKQSIKDILGMFEKLNAALPPEEQLEPLVVPPHHLPSSTSTSYSF